ncbi:MAG: hypothetical protein Q9P14_01940 [candidate division KSB1 bacterium]|nr:hypothetical protein [candidate division KSB1 bacterium]
MLGKVEAYESLPTGHFNVLLRGMVRIRALECVCDYPYRRMRVQPLMDEDFPLHRGGENTVVQSHVRHRRALSG